MADVQQFDTGITADEDEAFASSSEPVSRMTLLSSLREELSKKLETEPLELVVPNRPKIKMVFSTDVDTYQTQLWRKRSADKTLPEGFDNLKFSCIVIANQCEGIKFDGVLAVDEKGNALTFRDKELLDMMGGASGRATDAVRWLYGADAHIFKAVEEIFTAAGYNDDEDAGDGDDDPTVIS